jgi:Holliday junction resolvase-like predicted endonuclease
MSTRDCGKKGEDIALAFLLEQGFQKTLPPPFSDRYYPLTPTAHHRFDQYAPPFDLLLQRNGRRYGFQIKYATNAAKHASFAVRWRNLERLIRQGKQYGFVPSLVFIHEKRVCYFHLDYENLSVRLKDVEGMTALDAYTE